MCYQFKMAYTVQELTVLSRVAARYYRREFTVAVRVLSFVVGLVLLGYGVLYLLGSFLLVNDPRYSFLGGILVLLGLFYLGISFFYHKLSAWLRRRRQLKGTEEVTITLDDTGVREQSQKADVFYPYTSFIGCFHSQERYLLFLDKKHGVILPKAAITMGDPGRLREFIAQKTGKTVEYVK